jgi:hypothetical protein
MMKGSAMLKTFTALLFGLLFSVSPPGTAANERASSTGETLEETVTVQAVDVPNRLLTIKTSDGGVQTLIVPAEVKNLPQLKPGDKIRTRYTLAVAAEIKQPGEAVHTSEAKERAAVAPAGAKPGAVAQREVKKVITVKATDPVKHTLTFQGPEGNTRILTVRKPEMQAFLKKLKPGDIVEVVFTEGVAIDVQAAQ